MQRSAWVSRLGQRRAGQRERAGAASSHPRHPRPAPLWHTLQLAASVVQASLLRCTAALAHMTSTLASTTPLEWSVCSSRAAARAAQLVPPASSWLRRASAAAIRPARPKLRAAGVGGGERHGRGTTHMSSASMRGGGLCLRLQAGNLAVAGSPHPPTHQSMVS